MRESGTTASLDSPAGVNIGKGLCRVLVVEDVDTTRRRVCAALRARGYHVDEARNGVEGMRLLQAESSRYDAILLDLLLPGLDGWQFREAQLRNQQLSRIPTIILTVRPLREADRYALRAQTVIQKPFEDDVLVTTVASACATNSTATPSGPRGTDATDRSGIELFWSRRGEVACRAHAPETASERWTTERWALIPSGAGRDRLTYQCQHCSGRGPIHRRSGANLGSFE